MAGVVGGGVVGVPGEGGVVDGGVGLGEPGPLGFEVCGVEGDDGVEGEPLLPPLPSLRLSGTVPVPSGISWVPLRKYSSQDRTVLR